VGEDQLLAEAEAIELSKKPLDEILNLDNGKDKDKSALVDLNPVMDVKDGAMQFSLEEDPEEAE
jgi:hypothetical protein